MKPLHIFVDNHRSYLGIGEILYTLYAHLGGRYTVTRSMDIVADEVNIIIDEFSDPGFVQRLHRLKERRPRTRYVIVATEFVTPVRMLGFDLTRTFNYFDPSSDWRLGLGILANRLSLRRRPPYMHQRYLGFIEALAIADLVIDVHPTILETIAILPRRAATVTLYPEIDAARLGQGDALQRAPTGFTMTGTLTPHRRRVARRLTRSLAQAGLSDAAYRHASFGQSTPVRIAGTAITFDFGRTPQDFLFNLNPPQQPRWRHSSPMRILRATLLGQIPIITRRCDDHAIEGIARLWDDDADSLPTLIHAATAGRRELIDDHIARVRAYDAVARRENAAVTAALGRL